MPLFSFKCQRCGQIEDRLYGSWKQLSLKPAVRCSADGSRMERVPSASAFSVSGFNAKNSYGVKQ